MTYSPKSELVGVLSPSSINTKDIGKNWTNLGIITIGAIRSSSYLGNGITIVGDDSGSVYRSTDYGKTWTSLGNIVGVANIYAISYFGHGIVTIGSSIGGIYRSTDFGINWTNIGTIIGNPSIKSISYLGRNGVAILGTSDGHIWRSTDYGINWSDNAIVGAPVINSVLYLEDGIVIFGTQNGHIWRSIDYGVTWADSAIPLAPIIRSTLYVGNGITIFGTDNSHIWRSTDYGLTWTDIGAIVGAVGVSSLSYLGNGIIVFGSTGNMFRSDNFGLTWTSVFSVGFDAALTLSNLGNGVVIGGSGFSHIIRSDISYKLDEAESLIDSSIITTTTDIVLYQSHNMVNVDCSAGPVTITLPAPSTLQKGHEFIIKNIAVSTWKVTIDPGATTIDGYSTPRILSDFEQSLKIRTDGVRYFINSEYQNFTVGQLKPPVERWTMPGWLATRGDIGFTLVANRGYFIPFFVASTTFFLKVSVDVTSAGAGSALALVVYTWNDGLPGAHVSILGAVSVATTGAKTIDLPPLILHRGFYFMGMRGGPAACALRAVNFSQAVAAPVGAMAISNTVPPINTSNYLNSYVMFSDVGLPSPAPVPTGIQNDVPIFLLQEHA